jgi:diaminopimelate epimerase
MKTVLLSGAGNTFHLVLDTGALNLKHNKASTAIEVCAVYPADGFIFLQQKDLRHYSWDFYNNDGSHAEMCGNAARCTGFYIRNILNNQEAEFFLKTAAGELKISPISKEQYLVQTSPARVLFHDKYFYCNTGVPHVVIPYLVTEPFRTAFAFCKNLRNHVDFSPAGTNVTLVKEHSNGRIEAVTYERGVEDFTLACGTGALAVGLYCKQKLNLLKTTVEMPGGQLMIDMSNSDQPLMIGPATFIRSCEHELK